LIAHFHYSGSIIRRDGGIEEDVIQKAMRDFPPQNNKESKRNG